MESETLVQTFMVGPAKTPSPVYQKRHQVGPYAQRNFGFAGLLFPVSFLTQVNTDLKAFILGLAGRASW